MRAEFPGKLSAFLVIFFLPSFCPLASAGRFQSSPSFPTKPNPAAIVLADLNGDGNLDAVVANAGFPFARGKTVGVLLGDGKGKFQAEVNYTVGTQPESVAVGDFNGDGKPDIAAANSRDSTVSVLLNNGDGTFQAANTIAVGGLFLVVGDFNGDGKLDIANIDYQQLTMLLGNGDGTFTQGKSYSLTARALAVGDFNRDGKLDIAAVHPTGARPCSWAMETGPSPAK